MDVKTYEGTLDGATRHDLPTRRHPAGGDLVRDPVADRARHQVHEAPRRGKRALPVVLPLAAATALGLALRLMVRRGLWLDEATSVAQAQLPFREMLLDLVTYDVHPPLHHAVLWAVVHLLGVSETAVRGPSVIAGTLLIPALYLAGRELYDRETGLVAALLGATAPVVVWYSQEARMYAFWMLFLVVSVWAQSRALRRSGAWPWLLYILSAVLLLWTHYFTVLLVCVQQLVFGAVVLRRRRQGQPLKRLGVPWALALVAIILATLPMLPYLSDQLAIIGATAADKQETLAAINAGSRPGGDEFVYLAGANLVWSVWGYHADSIMVQLVALWPLLMLAGLRMLGLRRSSATGMLVALAGVPVAVLFVLGLRQQSLFELRYFMGTVPLLLLLVARAVTSLPKRASGRGLALGLVLATMAAGLVDQQVNPQVPRKYGFETALAQVADQAEEGDVVLYEPWYLEDLVDYYAPGVDAIPLRGDFDPLLPRDGDNQVFVVGSFLDQPRHRRRVDAAVGALHYFRKLEGQIEDSNVKVWRFR